MLEDEGGGPADVIRLEIAGGRRAGNRYSRLAR